MSVHVAVVSGHSAPQRREDLPPTISLAAADDVTSLASLEVIREGNVEQVLVLGPTRLADRMAILASTIASVRPDTAVSVQPLATSTLAIMEAVRLTLPAAESWAQSLSEPVEGASPASASHILEHVRAILRTTGAGAWVNSVAGLHDPNPSLAQHFRSWIPGARKGFIATMHPEQVVASLPVRGGIPLVSEGVRPATLVTEGELPDQALAALGEIGALPRRVNPPSDHFGQAWGSTSAVPFIVLPLALPTLPPAAQPCHVCGSRLWAAVCPTCHVSTFEPLGAHL